MAKDPIFPLYYNDIDRSTKTWTDEEFGAYVRLLVHQWDAGGLPNDYQKLTRIATSLDKNWTMLKEKFPESDGLLKNPVLEAIREKRRKHKEKQSENVRNRYQKSTKLPTKNLPLENEYENEKDINENEYKNFDEKFEAAIGPILIDNLKCLYSNLDIQKELKEFRLKCDADKNDYHNRNASGLRLAFQYQLKNSKNDITKRTSGPTIPKQFNSFNGTGKL